MTKRDSSRTWKGPLDAIVKVSKRYDKVGNRFDLTVTPILDVYYSNGSYEMIRDY